MLYFKQFLAVILTPLILISCGGGSDSSEQNQVANPRIVNGSEVDETEVPQVVRVLSTYANGITGCSGSAIGQHAVLTAAHCVYGALSVAVQVGDAASAIILRAQSATIYPGYVNTPYEISGDLAVVITAEPLGRPVYPLLGSRYPEVGSATMIVGYGFSSAEIQDYGTLRFGTVILTGVDTLHLSAEFDGSYSNVCSGDSGGPLIYFLYDPVAQVSIPAVAGVTSYGYLLARCGVGDVGHYTTVTSYLEFILSLVPDVVLV